jgi:YesN/AraC family two-component response regulator
VGVIVLPALAIIYQGKTGIYDLEGIGEQLEGWETYYLNGETSFLADLNGKLADKELHFAVYSRNLIESSIQELRALRKSYPQVIIIYYHPHLRHRQFISLSEAGVNCCIIGESQQAILLNTLQGFWEDHWKRIHTSILPVKRRELSFRERKILGYIEDNHLRSCNTVSLASFLNISESHFRAIFKENFGLTFRNFKKRLFNYYESVLLFEMNLRPNEVCELLSYKNFSGYSRSFKDRHGKPLSKLRAEYRSELSH